MELPWTDASIPWDGRLVLIWTLTALALVVVVLTRLRLRGDDPSAGRLQTSTALLNVHTIAGISAVSTWTVFLVSGLGKGTGNALIGIGALSLFWITVMAGLMILVRWMPSRGRHSSSEVSDSWSSGPGLSILAHVGMLVGVCVFTWNYLFSHV